MLVATMCLVDRLWGSMLVEGLGDILRIQLRNILSCYWPRWDKLLWCRLRNMLRLLW